MDNEGTTFLQKGLLTSVKEICSQYGLYGALFYYAPSPFPESTLNRLYLLAGTDPNLLKTPPYENFNPAYLLQKLQRNNNLFYPNIWIVELEGEQNEIQVYQDLTDYCKTAEFIKQIYAEYDTPVPEKMRYHEVEQLITFRRLLDNTMTNDPMRKTVKRALAKYFKLEKRKGFRRRWLEYYRSDRFPDSKMFWPIDKVVNLTGYFRRKNQVVSKEQLFKVNEDIKKLELEEHEYRYFADFLKSCYPDVTYAVSEKEIVDHGLLDIKRDEMSPMGIPVTSEEYAQTLNDYFSVQGWDAVANLRRCYWEFRDVYYKACDEPIIASVFSILTTKFGKCNTLESVQRRAPLKMVDVPMTDFMNFVSLAKANKLWFYVDTHGYYDKPSLDVVHVIYGEYQEAEVVGIINRMVDDRVEHSHILMGSVKSPLNSVLSTIKEYDLKNPPKAGQQNKSMSKSSEVRTNEEFR